MLEKWYYPVPILTRVKMEESRQRDPTDRRLDAPIIGEGSPETSGRVRRDEGRQRLVHGQPQEPAHDLVKSIYTGHPAYIDTLGNS